MTVYANLVNGEVRGVYDLLPKQWGEHDNFDAKCLADDNFMLQNKFVRIKRDTTPHDTTKFKMSDFPWYTVENGEVIEHRDLIEIIPEIPETPET